MRKIEIEPELRVQFAGRDSDFDDGVEVGLMAAQMATGLPRFRRAVSAAAVLQIETLARVMNYRIRIEAGADDRVVLEAERTTQPPRLRVVG